MGEYLSLTLEFAEREVFTAALAALMRDSSFFHPTSVGAIDAHEGVDGWLLGGYAVEDFVDRFIREGRVPAIELAANADDEGEYLRSVKRAVEEARWVAGTTSPFETVRDDVSLTVIDGRARLDRSLTSDLEPWLTDRPATIVYLYGALALAPQDRDGSPRERAFRFIADHESRHATPLLLIRVSHAPLAPGRTQVQFYSAAPGWLYGAALFGDDANGRATDEHIRAFSRLVAQVADLPAAERSARLAIEGRGPGRVVARLRDVLGEVLGANPEVEGLEFAPGNAR